MTEAKEKAAFICVKDTIDGAYPALVMAVNAARLGMETKIFYSFMGLNMLLKDKAAKAKFYPPGALGAIPGMANLASGMMKKKIEKANIPELEDLMEMAQMEGVELIACHMTVEMMEIDKDDFIEDVIVWTAEQFIKYARDCKICLFT
ncbi:DsrE/DsrF/DrsH-like family protein [bacterium]|nr:DsrE/DsrF/DrsH-like family protein [bacterium]